MKRKFLISVIAISLVFVQNTNCFAVTATDSTEEIDLGVIQAEYQQDMWHYKDGYWIINVGTTYEQKLTDFELAGAINIVGYLKGNYIPLQVQLPQNVIECIDNGDHVVFEPVSSTMPLNDLFDVNSFYGYIEGDYLNLFAKPKLNLFGEKTFDDFISGLNVTLPLVDYNYGYNLYSIYQKKNYIGLAKGAYYATETSNTIISPYVHPCLIKDNSGLLKNTYKISFNDGKPEYPLKHYIGWDSFKYGDAVGCRFIYPFGVHFTAYRTVTIEIPDDPPYIPPDPIGPNEKEDETTDVVSSSWQIHRTKNNLPDSP